MSKIEYRLSDLATKEYLEWLEKLVDKIENCGNDRIVLHIDIDSVKSAFCEFLNYVHTNNRTDKNKSFVMIEEYSKLNFKSDIFRNKEFTEQVESLMNCIELANKDKAKGKKSCPYTEADIQRELGKVYYIWCKANAE